MNENTTARKVWVLMLGQRNDVTLTAYDTYEAAHAVLVGFVKDYWDYDETLGEMPADEDEAIEVYFDSDDPENEDIYSLEQTVIR